jgi:hypothetical protein
MRVWGVFGPWSNDNSLKIPDTRRRPTPIRFPNATMIQRTRKVVRQREQKGQDGSHQDTLHEL